GVLAQRLVRTICSNCKTVAPAQEKEHFFMQEHGIEIQQLARGRGCVKCGQTGYQGRMAIQELLVVTPELRKMITQNASGDDMVEQVTKEGMRFLIQDGLEKVRMGY